MSRKFEKSKRLYRKAVAMIPGGVNSPVRAFRQVGGTPVYVKSAKGSRFRDADGNEFIDFCQSWGPLILGHAPDKVVAAVKEAASAGLSYGACHEKEIEFAQLILSAFPGFDKVRLVSSGTEAVMTALRIGRGATGRDLIVKFEGGYHGHFDGMLVKAGSGLATHTIASSKGVPEAIAKTTLVLPFDDENAAEKLFNKHGPRIAAVIIEPLPANNGLLKQRKEFLAFLRKLTRRNGSLLIFDEVISGFRLRFGGYFQIAGMTPDLITLGKVIGGGMPVGAVVGRSREMDQLSPLGAIYQAGTLSGNPVSLAAGIATLRILKAKPPYARLEQLGKLFVDTLNNSGLDFARAVQAGSILWPYFDASEFPRRADKISAIAMKRFKKIYWNLLERGFYLPPSSYEVLFISAAHSKEEVEGLAKAIIIELKAIKD
jgi:glutamate-1-semialdehyde 2,1-aminomutase